MKIQEINTSCGRKDVETYDSFLNCLLTYKNMFYI